MNDWRRHWAKGANPCNDDEYADSVPSALVPINGDVLAWALDQAMWSPEDLADELEVPSEQVQSWIAGTSLPTTTVFRRLAKKLRRPTSIFLADEAPRSDPVQVTFRASPRSDNRSLISQEIEGIRSARRLQRITAWLRDHLGEEPVVIPHFSIKAAPTQAAKATREFLAWSVENQTQASSATVATKTLRRAIEDTGVIVMMLPLGRSACRGFSLDGQAPLIAVNTAFTTEARSYTMLHELGHLTLGDQAICGRPTDTPGHERWCEQFAAAFLLPVVPLLDFVEATFPSHPLTLPEQVSRVARHFKTSRLATATALRQHNIIDSTLWNEIRRQSELAIGGGPGAEPQTSAVIRAREWGATPARLLFKAEQQELLARTDLQEYMRLSSSEVDEVRQRTVSAQGDEELGSRP